VGWSNEDGTHEGWAGTLFADGWVGSGWERGGVSVTRAPDGSFRWDERTVRPDTEVIGWVPVCECGWRGQTITRVASLDDVDVAARRIYSPNSHLPEELEDDLVLPQWRAHVEPVDLVLAVAEAHHAHQRAAAVLDEAVAAARAAGTSWGDIGRATGMTRQSANERWARRVAG